MLLGARIFPLEEGTHEHGMMAGEEENVSMDWNRCEFMFLRCTGVRVRACVCDWTCASADIDTCMSIWVGVCVHGHPPLPLGPQPKT